MKSTSPPDLSIVIPALREEKRIGKTLDALASYLEQDEMLKILNVEVIVVAADGGDNTDKVTISKMDKFTNIRLLKPGPKVGKGRDVACGMLSAQGRVIVFMDADMATPLRHISNFYEIMLEEKSDFVVGTRNLRKHHPSISRRLVSNVGNLLFRVAGGIWIDDSQCGFKMFTKEAAKICFEDLSILGWGFDMEVLAIARANNLKIVSRRISDWRSVPGGVFNDNVMQSSLNALGDLWHIFIFRVQGRYKKKKIARQASAD